MDYNRELSMTNIHNVVVALNSGGMFTCQELMDKLWIDSTLVQRETKIMAARNPANRTSHYARKQIRQEIRRTLYDHFNNLGDTQFYIYRATAYNDLEKFWVAEPYTSVSVSVSGSSVTVEAVVQDDPRARNIVDLITRAESIVESEFVGLRITESTSTEVSNRVSQVIETLLQSGEY